MATTRWYLHLPPGFKFNVIKYQWHGIWLHLIQAPIFQPSEMSCSLYLLCYKSLFKSMMFWFIKIQKKKIISQVNFTSRSEYFFPRFVSKRENKLQTRDYHDALRLCEHASLAHPAWPLVPLLLVSGDWSYWLKGRSTNYSELGHECS
jgi:hypothetical protein